MEPSSSMTAAAAADHGRSESAAAPSLNPHWKDALDKVMHTSLMAQDDPAAAAERNPPDVEEEEEDVDVDVDVDVDDDDASSLKSGDFDEMAMRDPCDDDDGYDDDDGSGSYTDDGGGSYDDENNDDGSETEYETEEEGGGTGARSGPGLAGRPGGGPARRGRGGRMFMPQRPTRPRPRPSAPFGRPPSRGIPPPPLRSRPPHLREKVPPPPPSSSFAVGVKDVPPLHHPQAIHRHDRGGSGGDEASRAEANRKRVEENRQLQREEKLELLGRLQYFTDEKGFKPFRALGPDDTLEDIRYEVFRAQREMSKKRNVKMMQKALVTVGAGIEMANQWYNPLRLRLDGFSKSLLLSIRDYDDIFEELHWKYCDAVALPPEMKLIMTLGSSIWFYSMSNAAGGGGAAGMMVGGPIPSAAAAAPAMDMTSLLNGIGMVQTLMQSGAKF